MNLNELTQAPSSDTKDESRPRELLKILPFSMPDKRTDFGIKRGFKA